MSWQEDYRWMACSKEMGEGIAAHRHLVVPGQLTTVCGCTASHADVWRTNTTKLNCPLCSGAEKGKQIIEWQVQQLLGPGVEPDFAAMQAAASKKAAETQHPTGEGISMAPPGFIPYEGLPRKVVKTVTVSVELVEEKPTEVSVIPVGSMSRETCRALAYHALADAGFHYVKDFAGLDSNGFSEHGAFFGVKLPEPEPEPKPVKRTDCICSYNTHRPFLGETRTDITRNPKCPVDHSK